MPVEHGEVVKKGDVIARLDSQELQKELKKLIAEHDKAAQPDQLILSSQEQKSRARRPTSENVYQIQAQLAEARITAKSAQEQIEIVQEQIDSMTIRAPQDGIITTWEVEEEPDGPARSRSARAAPDRGSTEGDWVLEVDVPDDDMGPVLAAQSKLQAEIAAGDEAAGLEPARPTS